MNRINTLFQQKQKNICSIYFTAGYPGINDTTTIINALANAGVDMIEIGIPFSDPVADGPTIQQSNTVALQNGMSIALLFEQLQNIRQQVRIPLILMGYLNPILQFGLDAFCSKAKACGIDGLIIPDLPLPEYLKDYEQTVTENGLKLIPLITPQTTTQRIQYIDSISNAFIYAVTSATTTGNQGTFPESSLQYLQDLAQQKLKNPILAGFGIHNKESFNRVNDHVNGAIIGSGFIRAIQNNNISLEQSINNFINSIIA